MKISKTRLKLDLDDRMTIQECLHRKDRVVQFSNIFMLLSKKNNLSATLDCLK